MSQRRAGECPECGKNCALTSSQRIRAHSHPMGLPIQVCMGTGRRPKGAS